MINRISLFLISLVCYLISNANNNNQGDKVFHVEFTLKQPNVNPFKECNLLKIPSFMHHKDTPNLMYMKDENQHSLRTVEIKHNIKSYEPTILDAIGSFVYDILEDKMYNNWRY